jgi:hypothetical protein
VRNVWHVVMPLLASPSLQAAQWQAHGHTRMQSICMGGVPFCASEHKVVLSNVLQGADMEEANPGGWALQCGQNFSVNHAPSNIDFAAIHVWPDNWERCVSRCHLLLLLRLIQVTPRLACVRPV